MKTIANIALTVLTTLLLTVGSSGIVVEHCNCSGRTWMVVIPDDDCCNGENNCMSFNILQMLEDNLIEPTPFDNQHIVHTPVAIVLPQLTIANFSSQTTTCNTNRYSPPPGNLNRHTVLRV